MEKVNTSKKSVKKSLPGLLKKNELPQMVKSPVKKTDPKDSTKPGSTDPILKKPSRPDAQEENAHLPDANRRIPSDPVANQIQQQPNSNRGSGGSGSSSNQ